MKKTLSRALPGLLFTLAVSTLSASQGAAQYADGQKCAPRDAIVSALALDYDERPVGSGFQGSKQILEVFVSDDDKTWTIIVTATNGVSCILGAGTDWHARSMLPVGVPG
ncbi:MAG: hypothetical protein AAFP13_07945 [Pseudomonadota bacterium]